MYPQRLRARRILVALTMCLSLATAFAVNIQPAAATTLTTAQIYAAAVLKTMNQERAAHGLRPLVANWRLVHSAHSHNLTMASADTMSHQLPGEAFFATRIDRTGYRWSYAGENIGWNSNRTVAGAVYLEQVMYNEKAPYNGHRLNILSKAYLNVGIDVYYDNLHHKLWLTQDFGRWV